MQCQGHSGKPVGASGLGAVEPGYATYSTNAVESLRFGIKHLMDNAPKQDVAEAMVQAAANSTAASRATSRT